LAKVRWAERARDDLREIDDFIARDSPRAAEALVERVLHSTERLASFPESGRTVPEFPDLGYRELLEPTASGTGSRKRRFGSCPPWPTAPEVALRASAIR
jgi:plasmid stabilization system protein ParE